MSLKNGKIYYNVKLFYNNIYIYYIYEYKNFIFSITAVKMLLTIK